MPRGDGRKRRRPCLRSAVDVRQRQPLAVMTEADGKPGLGEASSGVGLAERPPLLSLTGMHKRFGGVHALRGADLVVERRGVVHALMGENGSGKSTTLGILCGLVRPDDGEFRLDGAPLSLGGPADALGYGIAMVSQETN